MIQKLPSDIKLKWIEGLRSGKYKQIRGFLYSTVRTEGTVSETGDFHCSMGVLAAVLEHSLVDGQQIFGSHYPPNTVECLHSKEIEDEDSVAEQLINMNDEEHLPFEEIAKWIEANL